MGLHHYSLACLLSLLPGPPGVRFEDAYLQLYPVDPTTCPDWYDLGRDIVFTVFTRNNSLAGARLRVGDDRLFRKSHIDFSIPTIIFFHAFFESANSDTGNMINKAYTVRGDHNLIMLSAQRLSAGPWYPQAVRNTRVIGLYAAQLINFLYDRGLDPGSLHLVGLSLGAQSAGVAGGAARRRPARITGLDPALPLFPGLPLADRLDKSDARFVDIIHTDAGIFGYYTPMGHADFYVNGGTSPQPGCELEAVIPRMMILEKFFCSHWRSYQLYAQTILTPSAFPSTKCVLSKMSCMKQRSQKTIEAYMGFGADPRVRGTFYVKTSAVSPYTLS